LGYRSFREFYPFYLGEHSHPVCRRLHVVGTTIALASQLRVLVSFLPSLLVRLNQPILSAKLNALRIAGGGKRQLRIAVLGILQAYVWAWIGHFIYEGNRPATFKHPIYSFMGDCMLWLEFMSMKRRI